MATTLSFRPLFLGMILLLWTVGIKAQQPGDLHWVDCPTDNCGWLASQDRVQFGQILVPENHEDPSGSRGLTISFAIVKAYRQPAKPDPVLIFAGGWGSPILRHLDYFAEHFLGEDRDLILYDYRGLGFSEPKICPDLGEEVFKQLLDPLRYPDFSEWQTDQFSDCLDQLEAASIDWNQYGSDQRARDAVLLAEQLPYDSYNLFGTSGGTRTIQSFIRYSTVDVRSVIMDSSVPTGHPIIFDRLSHYQESLSRILAACETDEHCNAAYPDLEQRFLTFLEEVEENPLTIRLRSGLKASLNRQEINALVYNQLYDPSSLGYIPFFLETMIRRRSFILKRMLHPGTLESQIVESTNGPGFLCYMNDYKVFQPDFRPIRDADSLLYESWDSYYCYFPKDDRFEIREVERMPVESEIPTLLLVGSYDPTTPPSYASMIQAHFPNSFLLEFPLQGHGLFNHPCAQESSLQFLEHPRQQPEVQCLAKEADWEISFFVRGRN